MTTIAHKRRRPNWSTSRYLLLVVGAALAVACSGGDRPGAQAFDSSTGVFEALNAGGFSCSDPEELEFFYESVGMVDALACHFQHTDGYLSELLIGVYTTTEPSRELLDDFTNELVVGPTWVVSIGDDPSLVVDAIGGELVLDRSDYPERPGQRDHSSRPTAGDAERNTPPSEAVSDSGVENVFAEGTAEWASSGFLKAWLEGDREAAAEFALTEEALVEAFDSGFDPASARLARCEFVAAEINGVYASYLCDAILDDARSIQFYVGGGASVGYYVAHVATNGSLVGSRPR